ncbi:MAG: hypothetical protein GX952_02755 [Firmicutes bacterium]|nr:hypothetical protein [Bacillota bacterium]
MRDKKLNAKLKQARVEAEDFFAGWSFAPLREKVQAKVHSHWQQRPGLRLKLWPWAAAALLLFVTLVVYQQSSHQPLALDRSPQEPPVQYPSSPQNNDEYWLSFFHLTQPDWQQGKLLAVVHIIIPYQINPDRLIVPATHLQLKRGQYLSFVGDQDQVEIILDAAALKPLPTRKHSPQFYAAQSGRAIILLEPKDKNIPGQKLFVIISEQ